MNNTNIIYGKNQSFKRLSKANNIFAQHIFCNKGNDKTCWKPQPKQQQTQSRILKFIHCPSVN